MSLTCGRRDRRATPPSVRFAGRRVYLAVVLMLVSPPGSASAQALCGRLRIRPLGSLAAQLDALFLHRLTRTVRKDGTVSYQGQRFEVPYTLSGKAVRLVVDPHRGQIAGVEDEEGNDLGAATPLDTLANATRPRRKPASTVPPPPPDSGSNAVELAYRAYHGLIPADDEQNDR